MDINNMNSACAPYYTESFHRSCSYAYSFSLQSNIPLALNERTNERWKKIIPYIVQVVCVMCILSCRFFFWKCIGNEYCYDCFVFRVRVFVFGCICNCTMSSLPLSLCLSVYVAWHGFAVISPYSWPVNSNLHIMKYGNFNISIFCSSCFAFHRSLLHSISSPAGCIVYIYIYISCGNIRSKGI